MMPLPFIKKVWTKMMEKYLRDAADIISSPLSRIAV